MSEIWNKLARAQSRMGNPKLDKVNPRFGTKYATLASVLNCIRGPLNEEGLFVWNETVREDGQPYMVTMVSDGTETVTLGKVEHMPANDPQKNGSSLTYSKRYSLCAAFCIVGEEDDDGNAAQPQQRTRQQSQQPAQQDIVPDPWQELLGNFYDGCARLGIDPNETWGGMVSELGFMPEQGMPKEQLAKAAAWVSKMQA